MFQFLKLHHLFILYEGAHSTVSQDQSSWPTWTAASWTFEWSHNRSMSTYGNDCCPHWISWSTVQMDFEPRPCGTLFHISVKELSWQQQKVSQLSTVIIPWHKYNTTSKHHKNNKSLYLYNHTSRKWTVMSERVMSSLSKHHQKSRDEPQLVVAVDFVILQRQLLWLSMEVWAGLEQRATVHSFHQHYLQLPMIDLMGHFAFFRFVFRFVFAFEMFKYLLVFKTEAQY